MASISYIYQQEVLVLNVVHSYMYRKNKVMAWTSQKYEVVSFYTSGRYFQ